MASPARQRSLIVPREHGAWGILLIPLATGAAVGFFPGGRAASFAPLALAALALFWLRTPLESWLGAAPVRARTAKEIRLVRCAMLTLSAISAGALVWLFWGGRNRGLAGVGGIAAAAFLAQAAVRRTWHGARTVAQMTGSAGLTATAPAAYYVVTGHYDATAWSLWAANLLFALNQIQFVQLRIRAAQLKTGSAKLVAGRAFLAAQLLSAALLTGACVLHWLPWLAAAAFLPALFRGFAWFAAAPRPLAIHALGKSELVNACTFGALLVLGMKLG